MNPNTITWVLMSKEKFGHVSTQRGRVCHVLMAAELVPRARSVGEEETTSRCSMNRSAGNIQGTKNVCGEFWWEIKLKIGSKMQFLSTQFTFDFSNTVSTCFKLRKYDLAVRTAEGSITLATGDQNLKCKFFYSK